MNHWVKKQTNNKIKNFLQPGDIGENTYIFLLNALYFKGAWKNRFDRAQTANKTFYVDNNTQKDVPTMQVTGGIYYKTHRKLDAQIVRLPYQVADGCDPMDMIIILPIENQTLTNIQNKLNTVTFESLYPTTTSEIDLTLPKFIIKKKLLLNDHLQEMGIKDAFTSNANFSAITKQNKISISKVIQQAIIEINEDGTEAASLTGIEVERRMLSFPLQMQVNRPFLFLLATQRVILFTGYVNDPTLK
ncbi:serine protease inhibitor-like [Aphidius gifuensis]|uniref:serine protease inhibitor-like n=1 Tax=Aphidius gifuensis TaxID=684658 RepID=UPI001CDB7E87|nr:serine protease inhibitor-like [Aphidius gifuensis]